jgi:hypothetical protein
MTLWIAGCATNPENSPIQRSNAPVAQVNPPPSPIVAKIENKPEELVQAKDLWA